MNLQVSFVPVFLSVFPWIPRHHGSQAPKAVLLPAWTKTVIQRKSKRWDTCQINRSYTLTFGLDLVDSSQTWRGPNSEGNLERKNPSSRTRTQRRRADQENQTMAENQVSLKLRRGNDQQGAAVSLHSCCSCVFVGQQRSSCVCVCNQVRRRRGRRTARSRRPQKKSWRSDCRRRGSWRTTGSRRRGRRCLTSSAAAKQYGGISGGMAFSERRSKVSWVSSWFQLMAVVWTNRKKCDTEQKAKLMKELHGLIRGKIKQVGWLKKKKKINK